MLHFDGRLVIGKLLTAVIVAKDSDDSQFTEE